MGMEFLALAMMIVTFVVVRCLVGTVRFAVGGRDLVVSSLLTL
jgi:hypothetical protein